MESQEDALAQIAVMLTEKVRQTDQIADQASRLGTEIALIREQLNDLLEKKDDTSQTQPLKTNSLPDVNVPLNSILWIVLPPVNGETRTIKVAVSELGDAQVVCSKQGTTVQTTTL